MTAISYPFRVADNSGNLVSGATITIGAVALVAATPANVPGAKGLASFGTLNGSTGISVTYFDAGNGDYSISYDPETFGEAYIPIVPSKAGSTITGANALIPVIATKDSSRVQVALPNIAPQAAGGLPATDSSGRVILQPTQTGVTIPTVTNVTSVSDSAGVSTLLTRITGSVAPQTGDAYARLGTPAGASVSADIAAANSALSLTLSLVGLNQGVRNQQYDGSGNLTSADICAYDTAGHATTNDGATGLVHKWSLALTYSGGQQATQSLAQVS